jgi:uncharacterized membrane protein YphA (DoxX/SURF4 family)
MNDAARTRGFVMPDWLDLLLRFLVGGTFVYASFDKILHPDAFAQGVYNYRLLPVVLLHPLALYLPWLELTAGLALILGLHRRGAALLSGLMLGGFMVAIGAALARGLDISCGCFNTAGGHAVGLSLLLRDAALLAGSLALLLVKGVRRTF